MNAADPRCAMLAELSACAYRLGLAFGAEAEGAQDTASKLEYFRLFDRCFFAVRVATALELRLGRAPAAVRESFAERDDLFDRADPHEREGAEREDGDDEVRDRDGDDRDRDRDREREAEPATLPVLLRTLDGVAVDAAALPGPEPAALPALRELLAHVVSEPTAPPAPIMPAPKPDLRARLAGSATTLTLDRAPPNRAPPDRAPVDRRPGPSGLSAGLAMRRATGPPPR